MTHILDDHSAQARIIDDNPSDPLLPGDVVYTPLWTPGTREKIAFTDGIEIDGANRPDVLRNLITMSGGEVVAELSDKGERKGEMDVNTRFLIVGKGHTSQTPEKIIKLRSDMLREADKLGVQHVNLADFLRRIGYKTPTPIFKPHRLRAASTDALWSAATCRRFGRGVSRRSLGCAVGGPGLHGSRGSRGSGAKVFTTLADQGSAAPVGSVSTPPGFGPARAPDGPPDGGPVAARRWSPE